MYVDHDLSLSNAQVVTASAASTNVIDLGAARDMGMNGMSKPLLVTVDAAVTAAGAATVSFELQTDSVEAFSSPKTVFASGAIAKADLVPGYQLAIQMPIGMNERYVRLYYTVATGPLTAGAFTAIVVDQVQSNIHYADAL